MSTPPDLYLAEVLYESGAVHFRYARVPSQDRQRWLRHGLFVEYSPAGEVISEGEYVLGQEHGLWRDFYPNGQLAAEGTYEHGLEASDWRYWNERGEEETCHVNHSSSRGT